MRVDEGREESPLTAQLAVRDWLLGSLNADASRNTVGAAEAYAETHARGSVATPVASTRDLNGDTDCVRTLPAGGEPEPQAAAAVPKPVKPEKSEKKKKGKNRNKQVVAAVPPKAPELAASSGRHGEGGQGRAAAFAAGGAAGAGVRRHHSVFEDAARAKRLLRRD